MQVMPTGFTLPEEQPYQGLLNIYTSGTRSKVTSTHADASATPMTDGSLLVQVPMSGPHGGNLDNAAHAIANVVYQFPVEGLKETLEYIGARWGMDSAIPIYEAMQSARTLIYGQSHFPYRNVAYTAMVHGAQWREALGSHSAASITAAGAVWATALGLDPTTMTTHPHYLEVVDRYKDEIKAAVLSPKIEIFYDTLTTLMAEFGIPSTAQPPKPPPPPSPPEGEEPGRGDNPSGEGESVSRDSAADSEPAAPSEPPPDREAQVKASKDEILKRASGAERTVVKRHERRFGVNSRGRKIVMEARGKIGGHSMVLRAVPSEPTVMLHQASLLARDNNAGINTGTLKTSGDPTHKVWQMSYGNMKVWRGQPPRPGRVAVLVDMSGSMGCWCGMCLSSMSRNRLSSGVIAMQAAAVIAESNSDVVVAGYAGRDEIIQIEPGMQPICRSMVHIGSSTPTCVGLEWMRYQVGSSTDGATIVLITDGSPSACSGGRSPGDHTREMAQELYESGVRFACIIVNDPHSDALALYPSAITSVVNSMDDLRNVQVILDSLK